jgi:hypothetical protein
MGIRKPNPLTRQPIDIRRWNPGAIVVALRVSLAHIISHDEDDVGPIGGFGRRIASDRSRHEPDGRQDENREDEARSGGHVVLV